MDVTMHCVSTLICLRLKGWQCQCHRSYESILPWRLLRLLGSK